MLFEQKNRSLFYTCSTVTGTTNKSQHLLWPSLNYYLVVMTGYFGLYVNSADNRLRIDGS